MKIRLMLASLSTGIVLAPAATFTVTNLDDRGNGSLRAAVSAANATSAPDTIVFPETLSGTIFLESTLRITAPVDLQGPGQEQLSIDGANSVRTIEFTGSSQQNPHRVSDLTIQNGTTTTGGANIQVFGDFEITRCTIAGGEATATNGNSNNSGNADGGGLFHSGGNLLVDTCLIDDNHTIGGFSQGGGLYTESGTATIRNSRIINNTTDGPIAEGGGIGSRSFLLIENCEIASNETLARSSGGGGIYSDTDIIVRQSTIVDNIVGEATGVVGYSVGGAFASVGGTATFEFCTITGNSAPPGMGQGAGIATLSTSPISLRSSIIRGNGTSDLDSIPSRPANYVDLGFNLIGIVTNTNLNDPANRANTSDYGSQPTELSTLAFHGGPTRTRIPLPGSPAIGAGDPGSAPAFEQRGNDFPRTVGTAPDAGATERQTFLDGDGDGIPDAVEESVPGLAESSGDLDSDGSSDLDEYALLGISAISDATRSPSVNLSLENASGSLTIDFESSSNRIYRLLSNSDLGTPPLPVQPDFTNFPSGTSGSLEAPNTAPRAFFFLEAEVLPEPTE